jgi:hypothetical protein
MVVIPAISDPPPVFVDPSGRRHRRLQRISYSLGFVGLAYLAMVGVSFAGAPADPQSVMPVVEPRQQPWQPPPVLWDPPALAPTENVRGAFLGDEQTPRGTAADPSGLPQSLQAGSESTEDR